MLFMTCNLCKIRKLLGAMPCSRIARDREVEQFKTIPHFGDGEVVFGSYLGVIFHSA